jgi:transcriptional regulator with XRE-family HTH domain
VALGLAQQQFAKLIGVTYQQAHKYETGIDRISAGRLYQIACALGVEISYFFEGVEPGSGGVTTRNREPVRQHRMLLELARNFIAIPNCGHQEALASLVRALAEPHARRPGEID